MVFLELSICVEDSGLLFDSVIILLFSQPIVWDVGMPRIPLGHAENFRKCIDVKLRSCYTGRFATTKFRAIQGSNVGTILQPFETM